MIRATIQTTYGTFDLPTFNDEEESLGLEFRFTDSCQKQQPLVIHTSNGWMILGPDIVKSSILSFIELPDNVEDGFAI